VGGAEAGESVWQTGAGRTPLIATAPPLAGASEDAACQIQSHIGTVAQNFIHQKSGWQSNWAVPVSDVQWQGKEDEEPGPGSKLPAEPGQGEGSSQGAPGAVGGPALLPLSLLSSLSLSLLFLSPSLSLSLPRSLPLSLPLSPSLSLSIPLYPLSIPLSPSLSLSLPLTKGGSSLGDPL